VGLFFFRHAMKKRNEDVFVAGFFRAAQTLAAALGVQISIARLGAAGPGRGRETPGLTPISPLEGTALAASALC
jgi:hypothetical protein